MVLLLWLLGTAAPAMGASLIYKNYIVRYDRGWDILCEPYVVKKDEWVLKIFRQKGEIAHQDFRDFLGIFQRLNPQIKDIDMIQPGQTIDIPLRKLEHGTLPGQASGVVTIPFVTLSKVMDVIQAHSQSYRVQRGDTVSKLIARHYGRYGSKSYQEGIKLFKAANPQVTNLNLIYAGRKVYLPDPAMREESWYASIYDTQGNLRQTVNPKATAAPVQGEPELQPAPVAEAEPEGPLAQAAATVGGKLMDKGTFFLPRQGAEDFELDLSRYPMLDLQNNTKVLFNREDRIMGLTPEALQQQWPEVKVASLTGQESVQEIIGAIFQALGENETQNSGAELGFHDQSVSVTVRAKWIKPESDQRHLCITPISAPGEETPESIRRYLEQNGIVLKEVLPGGKSAAQAATAGDQRHAVQNILALAPKNQKDFVHNLARVLGLRYTPNVAISFPYAGIQVKAYANLLSAGNQRELLVDFGDLYGDAVTAIRKTGPQIVQITAEDDYLAITKKLLDGLGLSYQENPALLAARRPAQYNTAITIRGLLYTNSDNHKILLCAATLHPAITDLLSTSGIDVVEW